MKEIKFRAWNKVINEMSKTSIYITKTGRVINTRGDDISKNIILLQFTGLCDRKGQEIYEGDILKLKQSGIGRVVWDKKKMGFYWIQKPYKEHEFMSGVQEFDGIKGIEIIGNVFQNKDLLEEKT